MKRNIIFFTSLMVLFASVFSCCFMPMFEANASIVEEHLCYQHNDSNNVEHHSADDILCDSPQIIALIQNDVSYDLFEDIDASIFKHFRQYIFQLKSQKVNSLTYVDPPDQLIPLYIQYSVFRI